MLVYNKARFFLVSRNLCKRYYCICFVVEIGSGHKKQQKKHDYHSNIKLYFLIE